MKKRALFLSLAFLLGTSGVLHALTDAEYAEIFGENWSGAEAYLQENRAVWDSIFAHFDVDPLLAESIVFPELVRYSFFRDRIEKATMRRLYAHGGSEKGNFSIGVFQMKATFAEGLEKLWMESELPKKYGLTFDLSDDKFNRKRRLERLCSTEQQCVYLAMFLHVVPRQYPELKAMDDTTRVRFLATAYNYSFTAPAEKVMRESTIPRYHTDFVAHETTVYYSYADMALARYLSVRPAPVPKARRRFPWWRR